MPSFFCRVENPNLCLRVHAPAKKIVECLLSEPPKYGPCTSHAFHAINLSHLMLLAELSSLFSCGMRRPEKILGAIGHDYSDPQTAGEAVKNAGRQALAQGPLPGFGCKFGARIAAPSRGVM